MSNAYWINADLDGDRRWHLAIDRGDDVYFADLDFAEAMTIDEYRSEFPGNLVVPIGGPKDHSALLKIAEAYDRYLSRTNHDRFDAENFIADVGDALGRPI